METNTNKAPMVMLSFAVTVLPMAFCIIAYIYFQITGLNNITMEINNILIIMGVISFFAIAATVLAHCTSIRSAKTFAYSIFVAEGVFFFALAMLLWIHRPEVLSNLEEEWIVFKTIDISTMTSIGKDYDCCGWDPINPDGPNSTTCESGSKYCKKQIRKHYGLAVDIIAYFFVGFAALFTIGVLIGLVKLPPEQKKEEKKDDQTVNKPLTA